MKSERVFLKQNVLVEPLFNRWYAWSYLISPASAAMYIANLHLKIMQSFVSAPQAHVAALKNPAMIGGPFINYDESRTGDVKALLSETLKEQQHMLKFANAVKALDEILSNEANGYSLEPLYKKVPEPLKGYVELVYDLNNHPSIRFIEGLLYKSPYYNLSSQSIALSLVNKDERPFVFSTPRLEDKGVLHLKVPFKSEAVDELFRMKYAPQPIGHIKEVLEVKASDEELFASFFTTEGVAPRPRYNGDGARVRYFNHACILIESKNVSILSDPLISYQFETNVARYSYADLPETIDYVLITHNHQDHCIFEALLQLRHKVKNIIVPKGGGDGLADPSLKLVLQNIGFKNVIEMDEMESVEVDGGSITALPFLGEHTDLNIRTKTAYQVNLEGNRILCAADSNNVEPKLYENIQALIGDVDVIFLGMECVGAPLSWLYGPLLTKPLARKMDQSRRLDGSDFEKAIKVVKQLNPAQVYVYAMGQEPWLTFLTSLQYTEESRQIVESTRLISECSRLGIVSERLYCQKEFVLQKENADSILIPCLKIEGQRSYEALPLQ